MGVVVNCEYFWRLTQWILCECKKMKMIFPRGFVFFFDSLHLWWRPRNSTNWSSNELRVKWDESDMFVKFNVCAAFILVSQARLVRRSFFVRGTSAQFGHESSCLTWWTLLRCNTLVHAWQRIKPLIKSSQLIDGFRRAASHNGQFTKFVWAVSRWRWKFHTSERLAVLKALVMLFH